MGHPLAGIEGSGGSKVEIESTATGWYFRTSAGLTARVKGFRDGIISRVSLSDVFPAPPPDREVVQLGIGPATSSLCNALYSPSSDTALLFRSDGLEISAVDPGKPSRGFAISCRGPLTLTVVEGHMRIHNNLPWFKPMDKKHFPQAPAGWCSWYYYYLDITEEEVVKNTDWLAHNLKQFGCEWVQIDDGWQGTGRKYGLNRDWFVTNDKFPRGMKWSADYIRSRGFRPGIWCIPFSHSDTELYESKPSLFVHREDGSSPGQLQDGRENPTLGDVEKLFDWAGRYYIDGTGAEGREYLRRLFKMLCDDWGYDYVKIDAQGRMVPLYTEHRARLTDPSLSGDRAYRHGLDAMKSVMGTNRFLLNCGHSFDSCGYCDGIRVGGDVELKWSGMQTAIQYTFRWVFVNGIMFYTDPDVVCVREPLPYEQAKVWTHLLGITGQLLMASDKMFDLPDERVELLRRIFPVADIHPMDLYPVEGVRPGIMDLKVHKPGVGKWDVVTLFNWSEDEARTFDLSPEKLGLSPGKWICIGDSGEVLHHGDGRLQVEVPTTACRVVSYWADERRPQFVGTNRHITQGAVDVDAVQWDESTLRLTGTSQVVGGDPYRIRVHVPENYRITSKGVARTGSLAELTITKPKNTKVNWRIDFARKDLE